MTDQSQQVFRAAVIQMRSGRQISKNLQQADRLIREAHDQGASYVLTPENTALMELDEQIIRLKAQPFEDNSVLAMFRGLARELKITIHLGSLAVRDKDNDKTLNRSVLISPSGRIVAHYDKIHLFDVDLPNGEKYRESESCQAGHRAVVTDLPLRPSSKKAKPPAARLGFSICYDIRFPALYRTLAKAGAHIITVPAAFTRHTGKAHWHVLLRARAIENGCFILAAAQGGKHENGRSTYGHSMIIDPWGTILAKTGKKPGVVIADIDLRAVRQVRTQIPSLVHDRPFQISDLHPYDRAEVTI